MAKVETRQPGQVKSQISQARGASPSATAESFGGGGARAIGQLGQGLAAVSQDTQRTLQVYNQIDESTEFAKNKNDVRDAVRLANREFRGLSTQAQAKLGEEASNIYKPTEKEYEDIYRKFQEGFQEDPRLVEFYKASLDPKMEGHLSRVLSHQQSQRNVYKNNTLDAENQDAIEDAMSAWNDADEVASSEEIVKLNTMEKFKGQGQKVVSKRVEDAVSSMYVQVAGNIAQDSPQQAIKYAEQYKDKITPKAFTSLKAGLKDKADQEWVRDKAVGISADPNLSYEDKLKEVDKIKDAERAGKVRRLVKSRETEQRAVAKAEKDQAYQAEVDKVYTARGAYSLVDIPLSMDATEQNSLFTLADKIKKESLGGSTVSDKALLTDLMTMPLDDLRERDITGYISKLNSGDYSKVLDRYKGKGTGLTKPLQQAKTAIKAMDAFNIKEEGDAASKLTNDYIAALQKRLRGIPVNDQTSERINDIIYKDLLAPVTVDPWGLFNSETLFRFQVEQLDDLKRREDFYTQNIPESLKGFGEATKYDRGTERYYVDGDGVRRIYDRYGNYQKSFKAPTDKKKVVTNE